MDNYNIILKFELNMLLECVILDDISESFIINICKFIL